MSGCAESIIPIDQLATQIAEYARCIDAAKHGWLTRIREFDAREGWAGSGCVSMVTWLSWWTSMSAKAASEHLRVARALGRLPLALGAGDVAGGQFDGRRRRGRGDPGRRGGARLAAREAARAQWIAQQAQEQTPGSTAEDTRANLDERRPSP